MSRARAGLFAFFWVVAAGLFPRYESPAQEAPAQADAVAPDTSMSYLPKAFPRPPSAWQSTEKAFYESLLSKGRFEVLVVPFQIQEFGLDRPTRSLMTAELALAIGARGKNVPDPYLVARALGDGYRRLNPDDVYRLARKIRAGRIVWGYAGYTTDAMRITIQQQSLSDDPKAAPGALATWQFENLRFSADEPPLEIYHRTMPELMKAIGFESVEPDRAKAQQRLEAGTIPPTPLDLVSKDTEPARDAFAFQLLAALTPWDAERTRERFAEKSMLALERLSPASPDYRVLKARAYMQLGQRQAALKALGTPASDEEQHLFHMLNGNLPEVQRHAARIAPGMRAFIARLELNQIAAFYGTLKPQDSLDKAKALKLPGSSWPFLAARAFTDWDDWSQHDNVQLKLLLDRDVPVPSFTSEQIVRRAASLGDIGKVQTTFDLSALDHVRKFTEARADSWCCRPLVPAVTESDYLDLVGALGTSNLVRRARFFISTQGSPQAALDFLNRIESAYREHPQLTAERARAELALSREADGTARSGLWKSAYEHAFNAYYWEQGQTRHAGMARNLIFDTDRQDYGYLDNPYASDIPFKPFFPSIQGNREDLTKRNKLAALANSTFDFGPVNSLTGGLGRSDADQAQRDELLKSISGRFAGNPQRGLLLARNSWWRGDSGAAQRYYRENIKNQPRAWASYLELGQVLLDDADVSEAARILRSYPGFKEGSGENPVGLSNNAYEAGSLFYWNGNFAEAIPLYRIAADLRTGSQSAMSSQIRIELLEGDYPAAMAGSLQRAKRYNWSPAYRDYLGMLHAAGRGEEAWDAFNALVGRSSDAELWETPLVGHRKSGASEAEIARWVARDPVSKSGYAGLYLLRASVTDRTPTKELAASITAVERPVLRFDDAYKFVLRSPILGNLYGILGPAGGGTLPRAVVENRKTIRVKSDLVAFAEAYPLMRAGDFARAKSLFDEALALYDMKFEPLGYLLPYYAFAAAKSGDAQAVLTRLEKFEQQHRRFDYYLARAAVAGLAGNTSDSLRDLKFALYRRPFTQNRPVYTEYQLAEICEWLYEATQDTRYRDLAVSWAKSVQGFFPWFAWPYALEAKLTTKPSDRERAIAMAFYLDPNSERLGKIPRNEIDAAVRNFAGRNPFLRTEAQPKDNST